MALDQGTEPQRPEDRKIEVQYLPLAKIHKNPWNPNKQNERTYEAEKESIRSFGFIQPILIRTHPEISGEWQIIDGEHRWKAAQEEGMTSAPTIVVDGYTEAEVRKLTLALNMHGDPELVPLGKLLAELNAMIGDLDELRVGLPYDARELDELLKIGLVDWDGFNGDGQQQVEDHLKAARNSAGGKFGVFLDFTQAQKERYDGFIEILARELGEGFENPEEAVLVALSGAVQSL